MPISVLPLSFWELEEGSGTRVDAVTASGNDLTDNNTVTQQTGKVGNCGQFTRANSEYLSRASNASLVTGDIDFSLTAWVYLDTNLTSGGIVSKDNGSQFEFDLYHLGSAALRFYVESSSGSFIDVGAGFTALTSTWYFLAAWHDSVNNLVGISVNDGTPVTLPFSDGARSATNPFKIGNDGTFFDGRIDQIGFWKKVLSAAEITQLYNSGAGLSYAAMASAGGLVASYYRQTAGMVR